MLLTSEPPNIGHRALERCLSLAQRYAEVRKGVDLKIVGYAADSILQVLVSKINPILRVPLRSFARDLNKLERGYLYERMSRESLDSR